MIFEPDGKKGEQLMTKDMLISRRAMIASGIALGVSSLAPLARAAAPLKVAGIHASPVENAWNSCLHKALQDAAKEGVIEYVFSEGVSGTDYPRAMREYAEQGNKLIIGEAYAVEKEARQVAADYPETAFVLGSSGEQAGDNFGVFGTWNHDGAYLAGMLAGKMTKSNVVGSVGAIPIPEVNMLINAFAAGVKAVNPDAKHLVSFIGTFFDPPKAREARSCPDRRRRRYPVRRAHRHGRCRQGTRHQVGRFAGRLHAALSRYGVCQCHVVFPPDPQCSDCRCRRRQTCR